MTLVEKCSMFSSPHFNVELSPRSWSPLFSGKIDEVLAYICSRVETFPSNHPYCQSFLPNHCCCGRSLQIFLALHVFTCITKEFNCTYGFMRHRPFDNLVDKQIMPIQQKTNCLYVKIGKQAFIWLAKYSHTVITQHKKCHSTLNYQLFYDDI